MTVLGTSLLLLNKMFPSFGIDFFGNSLPYTILLLAPGMTLGVVLPIPGPYPESILSLLFYFLVGMVTGLFYWYRQGYGPRKSTRNQFVSLDLSSKTKKEE